MGTQALPLYIDVRPDWWVTLQSTLKKLLGSSHDADQLMRQVAQGNHSSFQQLFDEHSSLVLGYCCRLLGDQEKAEDVSQEVWIKVVQNASKYDGRGQFKSWLMTMTRNTCLNSMRRKHLEVLTEEGEMGNEADERSSIEELMVHDVDINQVKEAIDELPETQRLCLVIWMTEEKSYQDIADELKLSLAAVKSLIFRAKKSLGETLQGVTG